MKVQYLEMLHTKFEVSGTNSMAVNTQGASGKKSQKKVQKFHGGLTKPYLAWRWL